MNKHHTSCVTHEFCKLHYFVWTTRVACVAHGSALILGWELLTSWSGARQCGRCWGSLVLSRSKVCKYALYESSEGLFCAPRKPANTCHPGGRQPVDNQTFCIHLYEEGFRRSPDEMSSSFPPIDYINHVLTSHSGECQISSLTSSEENKSLWWVMYILNVCLPVFQFLSFQFCVVFFLSSVCLFVSSPGCLGSRRCQGDEAGRWPPTAAGRRWCDPPLEIKKNKKSTRQQKTGLNSAMNDNGMLPGSYPHRKYMVCMVWNII